MELYSIVCKEYFKEEFSHEILNDFFGNELGDFYLVYKSKHTYILDEIKEYGTHIHISKREINKILKKGHIELTPPNKYVKFLLRDIHL